MNADGVRVRPAICKVVSEGVCVSVTDLLLVCIRLVVEDEE